MKDELVDNLNDRYNLILLKLKRDRNKEGNKELQKLIIAYPDYAVFERRIIYKLQKRGLIDITNPKGHEDENGDWIIDHPNLPKQKYTNEAGIQALNSRLFPSELREKTLNKRFRYLQIIGIGIAATGGLITMERSFISSSRDFCSSLSISMEALLLPNIGNFPSVIYL